MEEIVSYKLQDDGKYTAVIKGLEIGKDETLMIDNGFTVQADVKVFNPFVITQKQRRKVFALVNDIEKATGQPSEYMRAMFMDYLKVMQGIEGRLSLSNCSKRQASDLIDLILQWVFEHHIPLSYKTSDLMKEDNYFIYLSTINRTCVICGKEKSDLAHRFAIGKGRNRYEMNHYNNQVLALCRNHHNEQHQIGMDSFNKKYHLTNSWIKVDDKLNSMLRGESIGE